MLPHAVPRRRVGGGGGTMGMVNNNTNTFPYLALIILAGTAIVSFYAGTLYTLAVGIENCQAVSPDHVSDVVIETRVQQRLKELEERMLVKEKASAMAAKNIAKPCSDNNDSKAGGGGGSSGGGGGDGGGGAVLPGETVGNYAVSLARASKEAFTEKFDLGVPLDQIKEGSSEILLLYQNKAALPKSYPTDDSGKPSSAVPLVDMSTAVENCEMLNVLLSWHGGNRHQCLAIVPQYESYHLQKWARVADEGGKVDGSQELHMVSRGYQSNGREQFKPPKVKHSRKNWELLLNYFQNLDAVLDDLKPILQRIAIKNTVIVMVCNHGQSELLLNFVCSANKRGFDVSNVIVFATDPETKDLAEAMGLAAFYDHRNFEDMPSEAARGYGDRKFVAMMMAKVISVQIVSMLGYDLLFQDVDIVWFKNPLQYFREIDPANKFDIFFQDDGAHSVRYAPYSANSGFYFVRYNDRTRYFLSSILMSGDLVIKTDSHQQALTALLNEHVSLYGLRVKVLSRDMEEFPGGYQYHQVSGKYMRGFFAGEVHPYIFHMSWTLNKANKMLYFRQMGEWFLQEKCIGKKVSEIDGSSADLKPTCCSAEPLITCHYRDKPSIKPCKDSPPIDKGRPSFWK